MRRILNLSMLFLAISFFWQSSAQNGGDVLPITFEDGQLPVFNDFNGSATLAIVNPDITGANDSATVAENVVPANAGFAGVNFAVENLDISTLKGFTMTVWSAVADTPVLLKLENATTGVNAERATTTTTTGAWETISFDFSAEGDLTFESVTVFMNFNVVDPASQTYYWDNLVQTTVAADCNPVANITISNITGVSAVVSWDDEATALDGYVVGVFLAGSNPTVDEPVYGGEILPAGTLMDTATGLSSNTMYEAVVVSLCSLDQGLYVFSEGVAFTTIELGFADATIEGFTFYPNPSSDVINLTATENIETVAIYNLLGQKVIDQNINATSSQLDVANLVTGTYLMEVSANGKTAWHKVIKK